MSFFFFPQFFVFFFFFSGFCHTLKWNSHGCLKSILVDLKLLQIIKENRILPKSFYKVTVTLILKPKKENYRQIYLMNINTKYLSKILEKWIQWYVKRIPKTMIKWSLSRITRMVQHLRKSINGIHHINKRKDKNLMIISMDKEKAF